MIVESYAIVNPIFSGQLCTSESKDFGKRFKYGNIQEACPLALW